MKIHHSYITAFFAILLIPCFSLASGFSSMRAVSIPLSDRIAEADIVVIGTSEEITAVEMKDDKSAIEYTPVCKVKVEEVIWSMDIKKGHTIIVIIGESGSTKDVVQRVFSGFSNKKAIWAFKINKWGGADYEMLWRLFPENEKDWEQFIEPFRKKAAELAAYSKISVTPVFPSKKIHPNIPFNMEIVFENKGIENISIEPFINIQFEEIFDIKRPEQAFHKFSPIEQYGVEVPKQKYTDLRMLNIRGMPEQGKNFNLSPGEKVSMNILMRIVLSPEIKNPKPMVFRLRVLGRFGVVLIRTKPFTIKMDDEALTPEDKNAESAISKANLWTVIGPHELKLTNIQVEEIRALLKEYGDTLFASSLKCALAFSENVPIEERLSILKELKTSPKYMGYRNNVKKIYERLSRSESK
jgi:hypothetical protein